MNIEFQIVCKALLNVIYRPLDFLVARISFQFNRYWKYSDSDEWESKFIESKVSKRKPALNRFPKWDEYQSQKSSCPGLQASKTKPASRTEHFFLKQSPSLIVEGQNKKKLTQLKIFFFDFDMIEIYSL